MPRKYIKKNTKKKYDENNFKLAMEAVANGRTIREGSKTFAVPYTTLHSHTNVDSSLLYDQVGKPPKFSSTEEFCLEQAVLSLQKWGIPLTIIEFNELVQKYALHLNKVHIFPSGSPSYDWLRSFLHRHPNLILKKSYPLEKKRANLTLDQVDSWFKLLSNIIEENNLENYPNRIFNCDETGMADEIDYSKVIVHRTTKNAYRVEGGSGGKSYVSLMFCASATGTLLPPFVIYKSKRMFAEWCIDGPPDTGYSCSESGWMDYQLFYQWFEQIFVKHTEDLPKPVLLIVDGFKSHFGVATLNLALEKNIIIVCLPSNATHLLQPFDLVFFNPLKIEWKRILRQEYTQTRFKTINKVRFPVLLNQLFQTEAIKNKTNIIKSFMRAGVFPFNPSAIERSRILQNDGNKISNGNNELIDSSNNNQTSSSSNSDATSLSSNNVPVVDLAVSMDSESINEETDCSSFTCSLDAISTLDRVLKETEISSENEASTDEDDEDYLPTSYISSSIKFRSSQASVSQSNDLLSSDDNPTTRSQDTNKRKRVSWDLNSLDIIDDDDDEILNFSFSQSATSRDTTSESEPEPISKRGQSQRRKSLKSDDSITIGKENGQVNMSSKQSEQSIKAITETLNEMFGSSSKRSTLTPSKRTVLNQPNGKIMTEKSVIEQIQEKQNKKRSCSNNRKGNETKKRKTKEIDSPDDPITTSTITIGPSIKSATSNSNLDPTGTFPFVPNRTFQSTIDWDPVAINVSTQSNFNQSHTQQTQRKTWSSTNFLSPNSLHNSGQVVSQPSTNCFQCRVAIDAPISCSTCSRRYCVTCLNRGRNHTCLFCIMHSSNFI